MKKIKKITRNNINKKNMVALGYCQCQAALSRFAYDCKVGYNSGVYGWNYDLYRVNGVDIVTGYDTPYKEYSNNVIKNKLIELENKIKKEERNLTFSEYEKSVKEWRKEFLNIFEDAF